MLYTNIILTMIFLLLLGTILGAVALVKLLIKKLKNTPFNLGGPTSMVDPSKIQDLMGNIMKNMKK